MLVRKSASGYTTLMGTHFEKILRSSRFHMKEYIYPATCFKQLLSSLLIFPIMLTFGLACGCEDDEPRSFLPTPVPNIAETNPAFSNNGERIAFLSAFDSMGNAALGIYISDSTGEQKFPTGVLGPKVEWLTGDSELIINTGLYGGGELVLYHLGSQIVRSLGISTYLPAFDVSKDGKYLFYVGPTIDSTHSSGIYRYSLIDSSVEAITDGTEPSVSQDGSKLVFSGKTICYYLFNDSSQQCTGFQGRHPIWTHDGQSIVYNNSKGEIFVADLSGNTRYLVDGQGSMDISPDGSTLLFARVASDFLIHIWRINLDGTGLQQVTM